MSNQLRLYTFVNFYFSSIQQGIQSAHVATELTCVYRGYRHRAAKLLRAWEEHGKTMIVLNGGTAFDVVKGFEEADSFVYGPSLYPFAAFHEEPGAIHPLHRAITAWGIVLPPEIYNAKPVDLFPSRVGFSALKPEAILPETPIWEAGSFEYFICTYLQGKGLAR